MANLLEFTMATKKQKPAKGEAKASSTKKHAAKAKSSKK